MIDFIGLQPLFAFKQKLNDVELKNFQQQFQLQLHKTETE